MMTSLYGLTSLTPEQAFRSLSPRQRRFVAYYGVNPNAADAARKAGYSKNGAKVQGFRLLARPEIQAAMRCDGHTAVRILAASSMPEMIDRLAEDIYYDNMRDIDRHRAGRLLQEIAGVVRSRQGKRY